MPNDSQTFAHQGSMRTLRRWIAHVDMDAFFASIEQLDRFDLRGRPVIVANSPHPLEQVRAVVDAATRDGKYPEMIKGLRGVVASASYEARGCGVRSAMPLARALVLCPFAEVVPGRFGRYREVASKLRAIWENFSPVVEPLSLDEAFLDLSGSETAEVRISEVGLRLKAEILAATGLRASVGIASCKLVAKIASDLEKPDGLVVVQHGHEAATLAPLKLRDLPGIGPRAASALAPLGIVTIGGLAEAPYWKLAAIVGAEQAASLQRRASGIDPTPVSPPGDAKSISRETTLGNDTHDVVELRSILTDLSEQVAWTLRKERVRARVVGVRLRLLPVLRVRDSERSFGRIVTRQTTVDFATDSSREIAGYALALLDRAAGETGLASRKELVRLVGVGTSGLVGSKTMASEVQPGTPTQASFVNLPPATDGRFEQLDRSLDLIRDRFGYGSIRSASSVKHGMSEPDTTAET